MDLQTLKDQTSHYYNGSGDFKTKCLECDKSAKAGNHLRNGNIICDNPQGPCSCGAWHKKELK